MLCVIPYVCSHRNINACGFYGLFVCSCISRLSHYKLLEANLQYKNDEMCLKSKKDECISIENPMIS
jgi:hypothetical protein